jgi:hypothetical protein
MSGLPEHAGQPGTRLGDHAGRAGAAARGVRALHHDPPADADRSRAPSDPRLAADIPGIWHAATTTDADRKQLLRALVEQVQVTVLGTSEKAEVELVWAGGHRARTRIVRRWRD